MMISPEVFYAERRSPEMGLRPFCVLQDCDNTDSVVKLPEYPLQEINDIITKEQEK